MTTETLKFKIGLSGTYWDKKPEFEILVNNISLVKSAITAKNNETQYYEFSYDVEEDKPHSLQIQLLNKTDNDVVKSADGLSIEKDMLLNINSIEIDDIELEMLKWTHSTYTLNTPVNGFPSSNHVNLGFNGTYEIKFESPFYIWYLSNI